MDNLLLSKRDFEEVMRDIMPILRDEMSFEFAAALEKTGKVLTGALLEDFRRIESEETDDFIGAVETAFRSYGRFLDMKVIEMGKWDKPNNKGKKYSDVPFSEDSLPEIVKGFLKFVKEKGLLNGGMVPGYSDKSKRMPTTSRAEARLAWSLVAGRFIKNRIAQRKDKQYYNKAIAKIKNKLMPVIAEKVGQVILRNFVEVVER